MKEEPSDFAQNIDKLIGDFVGATSISEYIDVYNRAMMYDGTQNLKAANGVRSGANKVKKGFDLIYAPIPTIVDEVTGLVFILWGSYSIVISSGEIFD